MLTRHDGAVPAAILHQKFAGAELLKSPTRRVFGVSAPEVAQALSFVSLAEQSNVPSLIPKNASPTMNGVGNASFERSQREIANTMGVGPCLKSF